MDYEARKVQRNWTILLENHEADFNWLNEEDFLEGKFALHKDRHPPPLKKKKKKSTHEGADTLTQNLTKWSAS